MLTMTSAISYFTHVTPVAGLTQFEVSEPAWLALWGCGLIVLGIGMRARARAK